MTMTRWSCEASRRLPPGSTSQSPRLSWPAQWPRTPDRMPRFVEWLRTVALLRHPEMRRILGELRLRQMTADAARRESPGARLADGVEWIGYAPGRLEAGPGSAVNHGPGLPFGGKQNG